MSKIVCAPEALLPAVTAVDTIYFSLYSSTGKPGIGSIAPGWREDVQKEGLLPSSRIWDFVTIALAVAAADLACLRGGSADGWTRIIDLQVNVFDPAPWIDQCEALQLALRFLTGDFWTISILPGGDAPPMTTAPVVRDADCISLLSGGVDSLVGAIDLQASGRKPIYVSQTAKGDKKTQQDYAAALGAADRHFQWNHRIKHLHAFERSTRGRSIVFFAFAVLGTSALAPANGKYEIFVPENGFISLNVALNPGRFGSYSTKTTHPVFLQRLQAIWDAVGIPAVLRTPYQFKTKGEMLAGCSDQLMLQQLVGQSTSCGRFGYYGYTHCGRCVPCQVRRAAFLKAGQTDATREYIFDSLGNRDNAREHGANDINAVASAFLRYQSQGGGRFVGGALSFAAATTRPHYEGVVTRGLEELGALMKHHRVI
jgi:7-cyano-7-deazaguanine synthase in queuosine biosynthesis